MPAVFMARRSAWMPSFETAAFIQYQKTQGFAEAGGFLNVMGSGAGCAVAEVKSTRSRMLVESLIVYRVVFVWFEGCVFPFDAEDALAAGGVDLYLGSGAR